MSITYPWSRGGDTKGDIDRPEQQQDQFRYFRFAPANDDRLLAVRQNVFLHRVRRPSPEAASRPVRQVGLLEPGRCVVLASGSNADVLARGVHTLYCASRDGHVAQDVADGDVPALQSDVRTREQRETADTRCGQEGNETQVLACEPASDIVGSRVDAQRVPPYNRAKQDDAEQPA